ncbi:MAG: M20/M25/M40 family metallo-hydrolase [Pseudomonadota bacterium]
MSGHYDTVFPPNTFTELTDLGGGRLIGPGLSDMKGGLVVMIEALGAFEAGPGPLSRPPPRSVISVNVFGGKTVS